MTISIKPVIDKLINNNFQCYLCSYSAIDLYLNSKISPDYSYLITDATLIELFKLFNNVEFYKIPFFDAVIEHNETKILIFTSEHGSFPDFPFNVQYFLFDCKKGIFKTFENSFDNIKNASMKISSKSSPYLIPEKAKLTSKYDFICNDPLLKISPLPVNIHENYQKEILVSILEGEHADKGLEILLQSGFIEKFWPEIYEMTKIEHVKDFHPEGNVWLHTLESLKFLKKRNLLNALSLFLHDIGKAFCDSTKDKPFYGHAEIGAGIAKKFLKRLNFSNDFIERVSFLIKYHMLPPALNKIPEYKLSKIVSHPDFEAIFEIYRADISSSYKPLEKFFEIKRYYRKYLKASNYI